MPNTINGNVYYIDTNGALADFNLKLQTIAFACQNTTSVLQIVYNSDTTKIVYQMTSPDNNPVTLSTYLGGVSFNDRLHVKTITAGTAFFYLS